ncbi:MAG: hypothetical protein AB7S71_22135 [Dongiaceae bacterium]
MRQFEHLQFKVRRLSWWQAASVAAVAVAAVIAIAIVAAGLILIIAPVVLAAILAHRFLGRRRPARDDASRPGRPQVIDAEYEVISVEPARREPGPDRPPRG